MAVVFQHEIDHFDGITIDKVGIEWKQYCELMSKQKYIPGRP